MEILGEKVLKKEPGTTHRSFLKTPTYYVPEAKRGARGTIVDGLLVSQNIAIKNLSLTILRMLTKQLFDLMCVNQ